MNEGMVLERDAARDLAVLERDIEVFACYWERRKERFLDEVWEEFPSGCSRARSAMRGPFRTTSRS